MDINQDIIKYYDESEIAYRDAWHLDNCMALHYGFWEDGAKSLKAALIKENEVLSKLVNINENDNVLDAGCGVGGSSIYLARHYGCEVTGITLSQKQCDTANATSSKYGLSDLASFYVKNFHHTGFGDNSFSVVWFVESFGYSDNIQLLISEVFRVLKPLGRLIIADGFAGKENFSEKEKQIMNNWLNNWAIKEITTVERVTGELKSAGFRNIQIHDKTKEIHRSAWRMYFLSRLALAYGKLRRFWGKTYGNEQRVGNAIGAKYQYKALRKNLWRYNIILAEKPE